MNLPLLDLSSTPESSSGTIRLGEGIIYKVQSDSDPDTWYYVSFVLGMGLDLRRAYCDCPAYKFSQEAGDRTCKHIERVQKNWL